MAMRGLWVAGALLALGVIMTGCTDDRQPGTAGTPTTAGQPSAASSAPSTSPTTPPSKKTINPQLTGAGAGGLTIRYLDKDGTIKTVRVEDFRH
jgi:hypothetical protein